MKIRILILALSGLAIGPVFADDPGLFHTFTDAKGRTTSAQIIDIDLSARKILLKREDAVEAWVNVDALSTEDHDYIEGWYESTALLSASNLQVSARQKQAKETTTQNDGITVRETPHYAAITLTNLSGESIDNLRIDYCYYIGSDDSYLAAEALLDNARKESGFIVVGRLEAGQKLVVETENVMLKAYFEQQAETSLFGTTLTEVLQHEDSILAISFKVYGSGENGILSMREVCIPDTMIAENKSPLQSNSKS